MIQVLTNGLPRALGSVCNKNHGLPCALSSVCNKNHLVSLEAETFWFVNPYRDFQRL